MVVATAFAQYYVWAYIIFLALLVLTADQFYFIVFRIGAIWILLELVLGYLVARLLLERLVGKSYIFGSRGDLLHPVYWTWYSTYLLLVNIVKGLLVGIVRMFTMIFLLILQIGVMDRSNFPEGMEAQDPAFLAFLSTLLFHHRYRNPLFTAFAHKFEESKEKQAAAHLAAAAAGAEGGAAAAAANDDGGEAAAASVDRDLRRGQVRRRFLVAHTLHCNPTLAQYLSDQVSYDEPSPFSPPTVPAPAPPAPPLPPANPAPFTQAQIHPSAVIAPAEPPPAPAYTLRHFAGFAAPPPPPSLGHTEQGCA